MLSNRPEQSKSILIATLLSVNVVMNVYNLILIRLSDKSIIRALFGNYSELMQIFVLLQTIASVALYALTLRFKRHTSSMIQLIQFLAFGTTFVTLLGDILFTVKITDHLIYRKAQSTFGPNEESTALVNSYVIVASALIFYFVIKLSTACMILLLRGEFFQQESDSLWLVTDHDIEREHIILPPSYDQCANESNSLPLYTAYPLSKPSLIV